MLSTDPAAETKLKSGSTVTITVSKSREKELISETYAFFSKGATVVMDGINYEVVSCDSVNYEGDGRVSYTITAKKFENTLFFRHDLRLGGAEVGHHQMELGQQHRLQQSIT